MRVVINRKDLLSVLGELNKITVGKARNLISKCTTFSINDNKIELFAGNARVYREFTLDCVESDIHSFSFCVLTDLLLRFLRFCRNEEVVFEIDTRTKMCVIKEDNTEFLVYFFELESFSNFNQKNKKEGLSCWIKNDLFKDVVSSVISIIGDDYGFDCVKFDFGETIKIICTDGERMNCGVVKDIMHFDFDGTVSFTLSLKNVNDMLNFLNFCKNDSLLRVIVHDNQIELYNEQNCCKIKFCDDSNCFLSFDDLSFKYREEFGKMMLNCDDFYRMLKRFSILYEKGFSKVVFGMERCRLQAKINHRAYGSISDSIPAIYNSKTSPVYIGLNPYYLMDAIKKSVGKGVTLYYRDNHSPVVFDCCKEDYETFSLIMPMQVS